jgi:hypothetical protein
MSLVWRGAKLRRVMIRFTTWREFKLYVSSNGWANNELKTIQEVVTFVKYLTETTSQWQPDRLTYVLHEVSNEHRSPSGFLLFKEVVSKSSNIP